MFYKLIFDGDWFTFTKRKDSVSPPCYSFMPTSTYPKEWKNRYVFVSTAMLVESPPLKDPKAPIEDSVTVLSVDEIVQWKRMNENPTRAFTFLEGVLAMGSLSPLYSVRPKAFFGKKKMTLWGLLQGDCRDIKFMVEDKVNPEMGYVFEKKTSGKGSYIHVGVSVVLEKGEKTPSPEEISYEEAEGSRGSLRAKSLSDSDDDEDLESRLLRKRRVDQAGGPKKPFPATKAASEIPPAGAKNSLSKHLRSSFLLVKDKAWEISVAHVNLAFDVSSLRATGTSKPTQPEDLFPRSPLAPLFAEALPVPYVPIWKITSSIIVNKLREINEGLRAELKTSQTVAAELRCQVTDTERKLLEEKQRERAWEKERMAWIEEMEELVAELKNQKEVDSMSGANLETMYTEWGMATDDNQRLAQECYWLISQGFGLFLSTVSKSEEFKSSLERIYMAYRDVGYQAGLKDGYTHSSQGLNRKETPLYNSKAKKQLSKLDKEFGETTHALLEKILERPLMSLDELKALLTPAGPSSPKWLPGYASP
ncbi:hypothetical protein Hanom_Chr15g01393201 [Helianthus anomalus]